MYLIIKEFQQRLKNDRNFSESAIKCYSRSCMLLDSHMKLVSFGSRGVDVPSNIELEDVEEFAEYQKYKQKDVKTINNYLAWIRAFLKFCSHKWLEVMDYNRIIFAKEPERHITALPQDQMEKLLLFMRNDQTKNEITRMRDYAMWLVLQYCWLRVSELCNLKVSDIDESIQIMWKWQTNRLVYLHADYIKVIKLYLFLRRRLKIRSQYVFVSHANNYKWHPLSRASVEKIFADASKRAWVEKTRPHKIRHTCATTLLDRGGELIYISKLLWHKNITTTQTYLDLSNNKLKMTQNLIPVVE